MTKAPPCRFRVGGPEDVAAIVALVESAYRGEASRAGWTTEADLLDGRRTGEDEIAALMAAPDSLFLLGEGPSCERAAGKGGEGTSGTHARGEQADTLLVSAHLQRQGDDAHFGMFSVRPTLQGAGIGRAALAEAERLAREHWGCRAMRMTVIAQREELIAWYGRRGYRRTGETRPFPYGDARFGIPKRDDLRFDVLCKVL